MQLRASFEIDSAFLAEGTLIVSQQLRSIFRNYSRSHRISFELGDGESVPGAFYGSQGRLHTKELALWCQRCGLLEGDRLAIAPAQERPGVFLVESERALDEEPAEVPDTVVERVEVLVPSGRDVIKCFGKSPRADVPQWAIARAARNCLETGAMDCLTCLDEVSGVVFYQHQVETVRRVLQDMHGRALLADEVGLGKTIEAGLILKEYLARGLVERFIIFTPASLVLQWQEELRSKFAIDCVNHLELDDWDEHHGIVASLDTAKSTRHRSAISKVDWDLVIVDEAHKLKNQRTLNWRFINSLQPRFLLLATATPVQNSIEEIYNLLFLVSPGILGTRRNFRKYFVSRVNRRVPKDPAQLQRVLSDGMVRHRREETNITFTRRQVELEPVPFNPEEEALYSDLYQFVREHYGQLGYFDAGLNRLTLMLLERIVTSSPQGFVASVTRMLENPAMAPYYRDRLKKLLVLAKAVKRCSKTERTVEEVMKIDEKVVIYTQFRESQRCLARRFREHGEEPLLFHGGLTAYARERVIQKFSSDHRILISTDSGGEGKNLQFCRNLINYDLPWNPMKVEQRIGRIHRLGQKRDVRIRNFFYLDSIEEYVVKLLADKIRLFTLVVGEVDTILGLSKLQGDLEKTILDVYMKSDNRQEREQAFEHLGERLSQALEQYEVIKKAQDEYFRF